MWVRTEKLNLSVKNPFEDIHKGVLYAVQPP